MTRKPAILLLIPLMMVLCLNAFAYTGESDLEDTIRALKIMIGQTNADPILAGEHIDGDRKIGLGEAVYWMQDAAGIPFVDPQAQDYEEDFLLSALDFEIPVGERQEITVFDTPRVGLDDQAYNREDLIFTLIKGEGVARVETEDDTDSVEDTYYFFRGLSQGVAVFQISYDGYTGQKPLVAINVTEADTTGPALETDIILTKYDIIYFTGESIKFTFKVITDEGASVTAKVGGTVYTPTDDTFTADLFNGYNPIVITATGNAGTTTKVVNIRAKKCAYSVVNTTRPDSELFYEGDTINLNFTGLTVPVPKVSHIYNPSTNTVTYDTTMPRYSVITGGTAQYTVKNVGMELTATGDYVLTNGHLDVNWFGEALYSETPVGRAPYNLNASQADKSFCVLPDIPITVLENPDYDPELFTINIANTEDIWPGDLVVLKIPDLDTETIASNHPVDTVSWMPKTLTDSYSFFVTDIPGLETVTSDHAENLFSLDTLKTIKLWIPEDTTPGTYKVRGGYVWVKYGPTWWTKVAYYHKGKIPDVTIEVKAAVPGQVHGAVSISNDTVKNRLAMALGKEDGYTGDLTTAELKTLTGELDLSGSGITDEDMVLMQYFTGVTAIDMSDNTGITSETVKKSTFDWTLEKSLDLSGCTGLTELTSAAFYGCANLVGIVLPDTITHIGEDCFSGCTQLAAVTLPADLETIGDRCFFGCLALTQITIPDGVSALGEQVFARCGLQDVRLPGNLVSMGTQCFYNCGSLVEITLPASLITIGEECFSFCDNIIDITLPESLIAIGAWAFWECDSLLLINLPASLKTIGDYAFLNNGIMVVDARESGFTSGADIWRLNDDAVFLTGIDAQLDPQSAEFEMIEETLTLTHQIPESETVVWSSSNPDIAVVKDGKVTGVRGGSVLISARTSQGTYSGYCRVTIIDDGRATLSSLFLSNIVLNEPFDPRTYIYTANIPGDVRSTIATLQVSDGGSTLMVNGQAVAPGTPLAPMTLPYPETNIEIKVTSADEAVTKTYTVKIVMASVTVTNDGDIVLGNLVLKDKLAKAAGKGDNYTDNLTVEELGAITGPIDLSDNGLFYIDLQVMRYLTGVSAIDLSDNTGFTSTPSTDTFDWSTEKSLDFSGCTGIETWNSAFRGIENLTGIVLPETVTRFTSNAFAGCTKLAQVVLPSSLKTTGDSAFRDCTALTRIDLPEGLETLGDSCFSGTALKNIALTSSLTSIGRYCFAECEQLTDLAIPAGVTEIGYGCFKDSALALLDLRQTAFTSGDTADWLIPDTTLVVYPGSVSADLNTTAAEVNIGEDSLTLYHAIPDGMAVVWSSTDPDVAVVSPEGVVTGVSAGTAFILVSSSDGTYFDHCRVTFTETGTPGLAALSLAGATIDQSFNPQRVYYTARGDCFTPFQITATPADDAATLSVNGIAVAAGMSSQPVSLAVGDNTFSVAVTTDGAVKTYTLVVTLEAVYKSETDVSIANETLMQKLAVAAGKGEEYIGPLTYDELSSIQFDLDLSGLGLTDADMAVMKYLSNVTTLDLSGNTALTAASATGAIFDWAMLSHLDFSGCTGITEIFNNAFEGYGHLSGMVLPVTVTRLGDSSFAQCTALTALDIPSGVTQLGGACFAGSGIVSVTLPGSITTLGDNIFQDCTALTQADLSGIPVQVLADVYNLFDGCIAITDMANIVLPQGLTALPMGFFSGCKGITDIDLPETVTVLGDHAFSGCEGITTADLTNMTQLGQLVLANCVNLAHVILPTGITSLDGTFQGCTALNTVELPDSLTSIGAWTFRATGITHLVVPAGVKSMGIFCFRDCNDLAILDLSATSLNSMSIRMANVPPTTTVLFKAEDAGLSTTELTLPSEATATLTANDIPEGTPVTWISSNTAVATVTDEGVVTAVGEGSALIAVVSDDETYNGACKVTVGSE